MRKKIISVLMIILMCTSINLFGYTVYGAPTGQKIEGKQENPGGIEPVGPGGVVGGIVGDIVDSTQSPIKNPDFYQPSSQNSASGATKLEKMGNTIIGFLQIVGSIVSVAVLGVIGIKYMVGSAEEKAEYKKAMMPYVVGAVMVFAITNLLGIVVEIAKALW